MTQHFQIAKKVITRLIENGYQAYIVGGWVRDYLMDHPSDDIDIATNAAPNVIQKIFPKTISVGIQFGIIIVVEQDHQYELATFRQDQEYLDGRRPKGIKFCDAEQDAMRRDFTINGLFYDPIKDSIYDFVSGKKDIKLKLIRAIGDPKKRFSEDKLRMIRAIRYAARFGFSIESSTARAIKENAKNLFPSVAIERIYSELQKMSAFPNFHIALIELHKFGLIQELFPHTKDLSHEALSCRVQRIPYFPSSSPVISKVLELFTVGELKKPLTLFKYLKLSKKEQNFANYYLSTKHILFDPIDIDRYEWAHIAANQWFHVVVSICSTYYESNEKALFLSKYTSLHSQLKKYIVRIKTNKPILTSADLKKAGIPEGPYMGKLLSKGERFAINNDIEDPGIIIKNIIN